MNISVAILRVPEGLDYTGIIADFNLSDITSGKQKKGIDNPQFTVSQDDVAIISAQPGNFIVNFFYRSKLSNIKFLYYLLIQQKMCLLNSRQTEQKVGKI